MDAVYRDNRRNLGQRPWDLADAMNKNIFILGEWLGHDLAHCARL